MSKTWYPMINYELCNECGLCFNKCKHGVYDLRGNTPVVVNPDECVHGCHGCGNRCPVEAIEYIGEAEQSSCCNSCNC